MNDLKETKMEDLKHGDIILFNDGMRERISIVIGINDERWREGLCYRAKDLKLLWNHPTKSNPVLTETQLMQEKHTIKRIEGAKTLADVADLYPEYFI